MLLDAAGGALVGAGPRAAQAVRRTTKARLGAVVGAGGAAALAAVPGEVGLAGRARGQSVALLAALQGALDADVLDGVEEIVGAVDASLALILGLAGGTACPAWLASICLLVCALAWSTGRKGYTAVIQEIET